MALNKNQNSKLIQSEQYGLINQHVGSNQQNTFIEEDPNLYI